MTISLEQARLTPGERRLVETTAGTLGVIVRGEGPDVVLIHGVTDNADTWRGVQRQLSSRARVHAVDLPGHGLSDIPASAMAISEKARAVVAYLEAAAINDCVVAGNSLGGGVTLGVCHQAPERVRSAILLCSVGAPFSMPFGLGLLRHPGIAETMPRIARSRGLRRALLRDTFHRGFRPSEEQLSDYWRQWHVEGRPRYIRSLLRQIQVDEPLPWLSKMKMPIHVVHGEEDRIIPARVGGEIARQLCNAELTILKGIGHEPQHECLEKTCQFFESALAS